MIFGKLRNKLIAFVFVATILPMATFVLITQMFTKDKLSEKAIYDSSSLISQGKANISNYIQTIQQTTKLIYNNDQLMDILKNKVHDYFDENRIYASEQQIKQTLLSIGYAVSDARQVYLYAEQPDRSYLVTDSREILPNSDREPYRPEIQAGHNEVIPPHGMTNYGKSFIQYSAQVMTFRHSLYDIVSKTSLGSLSIDISLDSIRAIGEQLHTPNEEELYILDDQGAVLYASDSQLMGRTLDEGWVRQLMEEQQIQAQGSFRLKNSEFSGIHIYHQFETPYSNWTIVKRIPDSFLFRNERQLTQIITMIGLGFLTLAILATIYISVKLTSPIGELIGYINQIELGHMDVEIQVKGKDEISSLARRFKSMMHTINELFLREYKLEAANKTNELKALQAQINPHFLNNSLQSIGSVALQEGNRDVYRLISSLGRMMRYSMNTNETIVTLRDELEYAGSYLHLQKQRFREQFEQVIENDVPSDDTIYMPKMIIQPLIENYFKHGFEGGDKASMIAIRCYLSEDGQFVHIGIEDNGSGISEEELESLRRKLGDSQTVRTGMTGSIGLANVYSRLKLYYRDQAQMSVDHRYPQGFKVHLMIPVRQSREELML